MKINMYMYKTFEESLKRLSSTEQLQVKKAIECFLQDRHCPGLHWHRIEQAREKSFASIRATLDIRIILYSKKDTDAFCYVDHHNDAYDWAKKRIISENDFSIYQYPEIVVPKKSPLSNVRVHSLFERWSDEDLTYFCVPKDWIERVRQITNSEEILDLMDGHLPETTCEALLTLAEGKRPEKRDPSGSEFIKIETHAALESFFSMSWESWALYLHPKQREIVDWEGEGDLIVTGGPGTGKTIIALHRMAKCSEAGKKVLLLATSQTLVAKLRTQIHCLSHVPENCAIHTLQSFGKAIGFNAPKSILSSVDFDEILLDSYQGAFENDTYGIDQLRNEYIVTFEPIRPTKEDYLNNSIGKGLKLKRSQRIEMYAFLSKVAARLDESNVELETTYLYQLIKTANLQTSYTEILVDECQNLSPVAWAVVDKMQQCSNARLSLFGDSEQRIFGDAFEHKGTHFDLYVNYRSSAKILQRAQFLLGTRMACQSHFLGISPQLFEFGDETEECEAIAKRIKTYIAEGLRPCECAVFVRDDSLFSRAEAILETAGVHYVSYYDGTEFGEHPCDAITLATFNQAPGLEYRVVFIIACEAGVVPMEEVEEDSYERRLLYVTMTRARDLLVVSGVSCLSKFLLTTQSTLVQEESPTTFLKRRCDFQPPQPAKPVVTFYSNASQLARACNMTALYHMTNITNIHSILRYGLLSKHMVLNRKIPIVDISDTNIQNQRELIVEPHYGYCLHDYASLYINPRNAMLYRVKVNYILEIDLSILDTSTFVFTSANAACRNRIFYKDPAHFNSLNWDAIRAKSWVTNDHQVDMPKKQTLQSEVLIYQSVPPQYITAIYCKTEANCAELIAQLEDHKALVKCNPNLFF